jgi:glutathione S-transferase
MADVTVYGFPISTYVNVVRMVLTHKGVPFHFHDLEPEMGKPSHLALHPFGRAPAFRHGDFTLYETSAICLYVDEAFDGPVLQPADVRQRAIMHRWISALSGYYYPYIVYHLAHERLVFPNLGIASDEAVVAAAMPKIRTALTVMEKELKANGPFLVGELSLADFFLLPSLNSLTRTPEGIALLSGKPAIDAWWRRMHALHSVATVMAQITPHIGKPIEHARAWAEHHRPHYPQPQMA